MFLNFENIQKSVSYTHLDVYKRQSGCRLNDGRLLWTDSWTLLFFDPAVFKSQSGRKKLMLTGVEMNGKAVLAGEKWNGQKILSVSPEKQNSLVFNSKNHDFSLYFSDLHYGMLQRKLSYRLLPEESEWQTKLLGQDLSYSKLPIGEYLLQVKLVYPDAKESEVMQIPIRIKPDWSRSRWAYWCYGGMLFLLLACLLYTSEQDGCHLACVVELLASGFVTLCHEINLLQAKLLWTGLDNLLGLVEVEAAHGVTDRIVRMAQCRISFVQQIVAVGLRSEQCRCV